jgi:membrane-associated phospholipid phosphatase
MKVKFILLISFVSFYSSPCTGQQAINIQDSAAHTESKPGKVFLKNFALPIGLIGAGTYITLDNGFINRYKIRDERNKHFANFHTSMDNYLLYTPILAVYGLNALGIKGKNDFTNRSLLLVKSELIMYVLTFSTKGLAEVTRPDNSDNKSFPSGHTAQAFAAATFMAKEYGDKSVWYSVGAYSVATTVGVLRILNNRHWISDVLTGAGIGILSTNIAYMTHRYRWKNKNAIAFMPTYSKGAPGLYLCYNIK